MAEVELGNRCPVGTLAHFLSWTEEFIEGTFTMVPHAD